MPAQTQALPLAVFLPPEASQPKMEFLHSWNIWCRLSMLVIILPVPALCRCREVQGRFSENRALQWIRSSINLSKTHAIGFNMHSYFHNFCWESNTSWNNVTLQGDGALGKILVNVGLSIAIKNIHVSILSCCITYAFTMYSYTTQSIFYSFFSAQAFTSQEFVFTPCCPHLTWQLQENLPVCALAVSAVLWCTLAPRQALTCECCVSCELLLVWLSTACLDRWWVMARAAHLSFCVFLHMVLALGLETNWSSWCS